jgi:hypothetical protein
MDQRRGIRYELKLTCNVTSPMKTFDEMIGVTQNISRSGLLLAISALPADRIPKLGDLARVVVRLPSSQHFRGRGINCLARVVRVSDDGSPIRIALEIRRMRFDASDDATEVAFPTPEPAEVQYIQ